MSPYSNFRGTFASGGHTNSICFFTCKIENSFPEILCSFLFTFELDVDSFGSRRGADYSEVVSTLR